MLEDKEIEQIMSKRISAKDIVNELVEKALEKGGTDNITVIVLEIKKEKKINYKKVVLLVVIVIAMLIIIFVTISNNSFRIIKDEYSGPIMVGQSYNFEYKGNVSIEFSNNNVEYKDRKITAINEGTTTITITDKNGKTLYTKTIKVFPNQ